MKETILYYHTSKETKEFLEYLQEHLHIHIQEISEDQIHQKMGYILGLEGFSNQIQDSLEIPPSPLLYFAAMSDKQLDILLELFRQSHLPKIPLKAVMTKNNLEFTFYELYHEIEKEYLIMSQQA